MNSGNGDKVVEGRRAIRKRSSIGKEKGEE